MSINVFRKLVSSKAGLRAYTDGFISKYIFKIVYPIGLTEQIQIYLALGLIFDKYYDCIYCLFF